MLSYLSIVFLCYCYLFEVDSLSRGMVSTITKGCGLSDQEKTFFDSLRAIAEIQKRQAI